MSDSGIVRIIDKSGQSVCLYSHSGGSSLVETVKTALGRMMRWDDPAYLARIIFCQMLRTGGDTPLGGELGFGISTGLSSGYADHPDIVVDTRGCKVRVGQMTMSFVDFVAME